MFGSHSEPRFVTTALTVLFLPASSSSMARYHPATSRTSSSLQYQPRDATSSLSEQITNLTTDHQFLLRLCNLPLFRCYFFVLVFFLVIRRQLVFRRRGMDQNPSHNCSFIIMSGARSSLMYVMSLQRRKLKAELNW